MPYQKDSTSVSLVWGRNGAAILLLLATALQGFGYAFDMEAQKATFDSISAILSAGALIQVVISKVRETKKIDEAAIDLLKKETGQ